MPGFSDAAVGSLDERMAKTWVVKNEEKTFGSAVADSISDNGFVTVAATIYFFDAGAINIRMVVTRSLIDVAGRPVFSVRSKI